MNQPNLQQFNFRGDNVLIEALKPEALKNGLIKPEQYDDKPEFGTVVKLGSDVSVSDLQVGDIVFFGKYSTEQTRSMGQDFFLIRSEDIKAYYHGSTRSIQKGKGTVSA